jgi:hypothetical protein
VQAVRIAIRGHVEGRPANELNNNELICKFYLEF